MKVEAYGDGLLGFLATVRGDDDSRKSFLGFHAMLSSRVFFSTLITMASPHGYSLDVSSPYLAYWGFCTQNFPPLISTEVPVI